MTTHPTPAAIESNAARQNYERDRAIMEAERNASLDSHERGQPLGDTGKRIYEAGFTNGWDRNAAMLAAAPKAEPAPSAVAEPLVRYCPGCGSVGPVDSKYRDCRPDGSESSMIPRAMAEKCHDTFKAAVEGLIAQQAAPVAQRDAREEASIGKAINRAARDLPEGWEIRIDLERHAGTVHLIGPEGSETMIEGGGELFSDQISAAIDAARSQAKQGGAA